jgi:predicted metallopeptidase
MKFKKADDVQERINIIVKILDLDHIDIERVVCMRSWKSTSDATARIWAMPRIWQGALGVKAHYIVEVLSEKYDDLSQNEKDKTLIHELMHIPKTFSGALVPHLCFGKKIDGRAVNKLFKEYKRKDYIGGFK